MTHAKLYNNGEAGQPEVPINDRLGLSNGVKWTLDENGVTIDLSDSDILHTDDLIHLQATALSVNNGDRNVTFLVTPSQKKSIEETVETRRKTDVTSKMGRVGFWARYHEMEFKTKDK